MHFIRVRIAVEGTEKEFDMAKKLCAVLLLVTALGFGLWAQAVTFAIGNANIQLPAPAGAGPKLGTDDMANVAIFAESSITLRAMYGNREALMDMGNDEANATFPEQAYIAFTVDELDAYDFD